MDEEEEKEEEEEEEWKEFNLIKLKTRIYSQKQNYLPNCCSLLAKSLGQFD